MKKTCIVDYGLGNLHSVSRALQRVDSESVITSDPNVVLQAERVILPGVGAFGRAMQNLNDRNLIDALHTFVASGRPFLGICLGMQLLMDQSEELGVYQGLGIVKGNVIRFPKLPATYKVPHIGYCALDRYGSAWDSTLLDGVKTGSFVYFVHSYVVCPKDKTQALAKTDYGDYDYCAAINKDNVWGCQFHPEKSGPVGLRILSQFVNF